MTELLRIVFLICGVLYGAGQFFLTSRFTKSLLAGKITDALLPALAKLTLYVGIFLFVWFYREEGRLWALVGFGIGILVPALINSVIKITKKGDGEIGDK